MMCSKRGHDSDVLVLRDEAADSIERAESISHLASGGRVELEPEIASMLSHDDPFLRAATISALVGDWRLQKHLPAAKALFVADPDWLVRCDCAAALAMFVRNLDPNSPEQQRILSLLLDRVKKDENPGVQEAAYEAILEIIDAPSNRYFHGSRFFNPDKDVDWDWLNEQLSNAKDGAP